jgi:hypothetical protein
MDVYTKNSSMKMAAEITNAGAKYPFDTSATRLSL